MLTYNANALPGLKATIQCNVSEKKRASFYAADTVFRAAENHLAFGLGIVNGFSPVIDPYGRITAEGKVNERGVAVGETFVLTGEPICTRFWDWFGWTLVAALTAILKKNNWMLI